jgi:hypothetical protein
VESSVVGEKVVPIMGIEASKHHLIAFSAQSSRVECYMGDIWTGDGCSVGDVGSRDLLRPPGDIGLWITTDVVASCHSDGRCKYCCSPRIYSRTVQACRLGRMFANISQQLGQLTESNSNEVHIEHAMGAAIAIRSKSSLWVDICLQLLITKSLDLCQQMCTSVALEGTSRIRECVSWSAACLVMTGRCLGTYQRGVSAKNSVSLEESIGIINVEVSK